MSDYGSCPDCGRPLDGWHQNDCPACGWEATR